MANVLYLRAEAMQTMGIIMTTRRGPHANVTGLSLWGDGSDVHQIEQIDNGLHWQLKAPGVELTFLMVSDAEMAARRRIRTQIVARELG